MGATKDIALANGSSARADDGGIATLLTEVAVGRNQIRTPSLRTTASVGLFSSGVGL